MTLHPNPSSPNARLTRRTAILGTALTLSAGASRAGCRPARVLFVCPAGSVKSAIAREALRRRAAGSGLAVSVSSRGVHPEDHLSPALAARLRTDGLDPASEPVRRLAGADIARADLIVAFDAAADEASLHAAQAWKTPSWNTDDAAAKADLDTRLNGLLADLKTRAAQPCAVTTPCLGD